MKTPAKVNLLTVSVFVSLLSAEIVLRVFAPQRRNTLVDTIPMYESDSSKIPEGTLFVPKPNVPLHQAKSELEDFRYTTQTNNLGLIQQKDYNGENGLLGYVLGDSFAEGVLANIDENYFASLQKYLPACTLLNLSVTAYGTYNEYYRLKSINDLLCSRYKKKASFVILHVYLGNDISDNARYKSKAVHIRKERLTNWLAAHLHTYRFYRKFIQKWGRSDRGPYGVPANSEFHDANAVLKKYLVATPLTPTKNALDLIIDYCQKHQIGLYAVLIPTQEMASKTLRRKYSALYGADARFDDAESFFRHALQERGVVTLSLTEYFLSQKNSERLYHTYDSHWTAEGQQIAARYIAEKMAPLLHKYP